MANEITNNIERKIKNGIKILFDYSSLGLPSSHEDGTTWVLYPVMAGVTDSIERN